MDLMTIASWTLSLVLGIMTFLFIFRIVLTWYPQVDLTRFPFNVIAVPTEPFLATSRKIVSPIGGVDITPIIWVGIMSFLREILLGQQGLLTMMMMDGKGF
ncbi:MAG: YggT family protein [Leptolyngbya sp. BL-A-14]